MVDTHCHFDLPPFRYHEEDFLVRARQVGVHTILTLGIDLPSSQRAVALAGKYPEINAAVGMHPEEVAGANISTLDAFTVLAEQNGVVAIGEVGLDYHHGKDQATRRAQQMLLDQFGTLAADLKKPLLLHSRAAILDTLAIVRHYLRDVPAIWHSFDGSLEEAEAVLAAGGYLGFNNLLGYPKNNLLREVVAKIPLNRIVLETDAPYLPPQQRRGQSSEPADVVAVAELIADLKKTPVTVVERATDVTARQIFGF